MQAIPVTLVQLQQENCEAVFGAAIVKKCSNEEVSVPTADRGEILQAANRVIRRLYKDEHFFGKIVGMYETMCQQATVVVTCFLDHNSYTEEEARLALLKIFIVADVLNTVCANLADENTEIIDEAKTDVVCELANYTEQATLFVQWLGRFSELTEVRHFLQDMNQPA